MTRDEFEVPIDLKHAIENAASSLSGANAVALHPTDRWHDCPECGERLNVQSIVHDDAALLAVEYSYLDPDCRARWVWEVETDELHYRGEANVKRWGE